MKIDLFVDLNCEDETGYPWTYADQASDPCVVVKGRWLVVGSGSAVALAEVIDVGADGLVHVRPLPGPVSAQRLAAAGGGANSSTDGASRAPNAEGTIVVGT